MSSPVRESMVDAVDMEIKRAAAFEVYPPTSESPGLRGAVLDFDRHLRTMARGG